MDTAKHIMMLKRYLLVIHQIANSVSKFLSYSLFLRTSTLEKTSCMSTESPKDCSPRECYTFKEHWSLKEENGMVRYTSGKEM